MANNFILIAGIVGLMGASKLVADQATVPIPISPVSHESVDAAWEICLKHSKDTIFCPAANDRCFPEPWQDCITVGHEHFDELQKAEEDWNRRNILKQRTDPDYKKLQELLRKP